MPHILFEEVSVMEKLKQALSYVFPVIGGLIVFFSTSKEDTKTKFHAIQSIVLWLISAVVGGVCGFIPFVGWLIGGVCGIIIFALAVLAIIKIIKDNEPELPIVGDITKMALNSI